MSREQRGLVEMQEPHLEPPDQPPEPGFARREAHHDQTG
jgi:hypothetical protein